MVDAQIDQNLYSRQIGTYGVDAMGKLVGLKVYIHGLRGLGIETAKNLVLIGPKRVVVQDDNLVQLSDLGSNFFCRQEHVNKLSRANACIEELKNLNPYVQVQVHEGEIDNAFLRQFDVVVFTDYYDKEKLIAYNNFCRNREKPIGFIYAGSLGLYGFTFVDFGPEFTVWDSNGEDPKSVPIGLITQDNPAVVSALEKHGLFEGDVIRFKDVEGMTQLNGKEFTVSIESVETFTINADTTNFGPYKGNGIAEQVKVPNKIHFKSLEESLEAPLLGPDFSPLETPDFDKWGISDILHIALNSILEFVKNHKKLPSLNNEQEAEEFLNFFKVINESGNDIPGSVKAGKVDTELVKNIARFAAAQTSCHSSFFGGVVAQEIVKYIGKFSPLSQWLHYENFELLPSENVNRELKNSRYDDYIAIFGREVQESLMNKKIFLVGAGALGCEYIKQFALTGMCCGAQGKLVCTDDDSIEISNLNRQFLFRKENVGSSKSQVACKAGLLINSDLKVEALKLRVSPENDRVFNDNFWEGIDAAVTAVDNIDARRFIDSKCVSFLKNLFDSGTLGLNCTSQSIISHYTQSYGETPDPVSESIPMCTLKNFPYQIEHTIQWARDYFENNFSEGPNEYLKYLEDPAKYLYTLQQEAKRQPSLTRSRLETVAKIHKQLNKPNQESCIQLAKEMFQHPFHNKICQLLHTYPPDYEVDGQLFWRGLKKLPVPANFDPSDPTHADFIFSAANLWAYTLSINFTLDKKSAADYAAKLPVTAYEHKKIVIRTSETDIAEEKAEDDEIRIAELVQTLSIPNSSENKRPKPSVFEKDDDTNFHIDFISTSANLRARNYKIEEVSRLKVKLIAGKIIPAVATSTAVIVGAVGFELYKFAQNKSPDVFKNLACNLAVPRWIFSETLPKIFHKDEEYNKDLLGPTKAIPADWTIWDRIKIGGSKTLGQILTFITEKYGVNVSVVAIEDLQAYIKGMTDPARLDMTPEEIYKEMKNEDFPEYKKYLEIGISGETSENVDAMMPPVKYLVPK